MPKAKLKQTEPTPPDQKSGFIAFFEELWKRLASATPGFFKVIRNFAAFVAVLVGLVEAAQATGMDLPDFLDKASSWILFVGAVMTALVAQLPTVDKDRKVAEGELPFTAKRISEGKEPIH